MSPSSDTQPDGVNVASSWSVQPRTPRSGTPGCRPSVAVTVLGHPLSGVVGGESCSTEAIMYRSNHRSLPQKGMAAHRFLARSRTRCQ